MNWLQLAYEYILGGLFFFVTLRLCFGPGAASLRSAADRRTLAWLLAGLAGYLVLHLVWIVAAGGA
jgi:hypothetical protein